ncbi:hypothetical protein B0G81_7813 [Paraburkholderia sp. BL6665CI2N2]|uniref:hypothetical protein n=1 Tax=Paraburkholderia sp. BL6665CI2N2 TaxID=1938806 RepID=UPI001066032D|nr:hypothetical protein [Paraburkholderia sp. BL6665CI2N2]TDY16720.1 hypothetical protein B0G81_7813 [Paraburkholderia sp. BL6665CI2N2]
MSIQILTGDHVFYHSRQDDFNDNESNVMATFLSGVSLLQKLTAPIFGEIKSEYTGDFGMVWSGAYSEVVLFDFVKNVWDLYSGKYSDVIPKTNYLDNCSGSMTVGATDSIYDKTHEIVSTLSQDLANQFSGVKDCLQEANELSAELTNILNVWRDNWLAPVDGVQLYAWGPAYKKYFQEPQNGAWSCSMNTTLTTIMFQSGTRLEWSNLFKNYELGPGIAVDYVTVEFSTPPLAFNVSGTVADTQKWKNKFETLFECDPTQEIRSAPLP